MSDSAHTPTVQGSTPGPRSASAKPPYEAPRVLFRQAIDRVAADCSAPPGKGSPIQGCTQGSS